MTNVTSRLSIIIPSRNEAKYIAATLIQFEKLLERHNLEIVVSDANSTDGTAEIVQEFALRFPGRVKLAQKQGKQNIAIGRNFGASQATGTILFHTDADVRIPDPERFFPKVMQTFENPAVVAATVPIWVYPEESGIKDKLYHLLMNTTIRLSFFFGVYLAKGECQLVRKDVFERIEGYSEHLIAGEDCNLFYRLHKEGRIAYLFRLCVHHSPRRFRQYGYIRLTFIYLREAIWMSLGRRSYVKEWKAVR
jgi:glycosyltransferase involved in cell wall biosynthesis